MLRRIATGLLASAAALAGLALLLEWSLRSMGIGDDAIARPHPWVGWVHIPGVRAELQSEDPALGRRTAIRTDSLGLRDVERSAAKPPGVYRVLLLGDSYVEGAQVPFDSTVARRMERRLDGTSGRRVEVWNCGVAGYSTTQELLYLRHVAWRYRADLVVLCFLASNDVADQVAPLATSLRNRPFFQLRGDSLRLDRSFFRPDRGPVGWLRVHSRLFGWVTTQIRTVRTRLHERAAARAVAGGVPPALMIYAERPDSLWDAAWALTERLLVETRDEAARHGADFLLVSIASGAQVHPEARRNRPGWERWGSLPGLSLDAPERRLESLARAHALDYLPLLPAFRAEAARGRRPLHIAWSGHWNSAGHGLAAQVMAERVAAKLARAQPPR